MMMVMIAKKRKDIGKFCNDGNDDATNKNKESRKTRTATKTRRMNGAEDILEPRRNRRLGGIVLAKNKME